MLQPGDDFGDQVVGVRQLLRPLVRVRSVSEMEAAEPGALVRVGRVADRIFPAPHSGAAIRRARPLVLDGGIYSQVVAQLARRWFIGIRGEAIGVPAGPLVRPEY